jgi:putative photosynthetic complex assembly protein
MSAIDDKPFPKPALIGAAGLVLGALVLTTGVRLNWPGFPPAAVPDVRPVDTEPLQHRAIRFVTLEDGGIIITDQVTGETLRELGPNEGGFISGALRGLRRSHMQRGLTSTIEADLTLWADGRLTLVDLAGGPSTPAVIDLHAFGATNRAAFASLLPPLALSTSVSASERAQP